MSARAIHAEFRLGWLIQLARLENAVADRRLNALENLLSALAERWIGTSAVVPKRDLRLSPRTATMLAGWVQVRGPALGQAAHRLLAITTGGAVDDAVPDGWIRVLLDQPLH